MDNRKGIMREALFESLRELMGRYLFEKITIKQICDQTGVIRATFYNYYEDKYDCLNAIVRHDLVECLDRSSEHDTAKKNVTKLFTQIEENREFYRMGYNITGQNSFEEMIRNNLSLLFYELLEALRNKNKFPQYSNKLLADYFAMSFSFVIKNFVFQKEGAKTVEDAVEMSGILMQNSILSFTEQ